MGYQEEKQRQLDMRYLRMASIWAENSYCVRRKVGALIVKDKMIISDGYNGTPSGFRERLRGRQRARPNPMCSTPKPTPSPRWPKAANNCDGSTLYITAAPCIECSKLIIQAGIQAGGLLRRITVRKRGSNLLRQRGNRVRTVRVERKMTVR